MKKRFFPGETIWIASDSPASSFSGVFEDDGEVAYFYAYDRAIEHPILDALHVYDVNSVADRASESQLEVRWSADGLKAGLLINDRTQAVVDFGQRKAYCRNNFPPPGGPWRAEQREPWREDLAHLLS